MAENRSKSDQYLLRLPPGLRGRLQGVADANARSLNAEIVMRLEESLVVPSETDVGGGNISGFWAVPEGMKDEEIARAIQDATRQAVSGALKRLGIQQRPLPDKSED